MKGKSSKEGQAVDAIHAWTEAGRSLLSHDPHKFEQILSITRAFVALFERGVEDVAVYRSRLAQISSGKSKASA